jgi:hypothetical protein
MAWAVFADAEDPGLVVEWFMVASWAEHLRQHRRVTLADQALQARVVALHEGEAPPRVTHLIALPPDGTQPGPARSTHGRGDGHG